MLEALFERVRSFCARSLRDSSGEMYLAFCMIFSRMAAVGASGLKVLADDEARMVERTARRGETSILCLIEMVR